MIHSRAKRAGWTLLDQAISASTNFVALALMARSLAPAEFGAVALGGAAFVLAIAAGRAVVIEPALIRPANAKTSLTEQAASSFICGIALASAITASSFLLTAPTRMIFLLVAAALPGALIQDSYRYFTIQHGMPSHAVKSDSIWLLGVITAGATSAWLDVSTSMLVLPAWLFGPSMALLASPTFLLASFRVQSGRLHLRQSRRLSLSYLTDLILLNSVLQISTFVLAATVGLRETAALRAGNLLFGPLGVVYAGLYPLLLPAVVAARAIQTKVYRMGYLISFASVALAAFWTILLLSLPEQLGTNLLGESWQSARDLFLLLGAGYAAGSLGSGAVILLRARERQSSITRFRFLSVPLTMGAPVAATIYWGSRGFAFGWAVANALFALGLWITAQPNTSNSGTVKAPALPRAS